MEKEEETMMMMAVSSSTTTVLDFAPKKLARQLDFTPVFRNPVQQFPVRPPLSPVRPVVLSAAIDPESPRPPSQAAVEVKDGTPKKQKQCNCKNSRCLKLYCECFASGIYCDGCNCFNCHNNVEHEAARKEAVGVTLERNPNAFRPKIGNSPHAPCVGKKEVGPAQIAGKHNKGCNCKKSGCLKKYCECFQANILCSDNCKCIDCKNFEGSEERRALFHGSHGNIMIYQAANAAINGAVGSSGFGNSPTSRKRRSQGLSSVGMYHNQPVYHNLQYTQVNQVQCSTSLVPESTPRGANGQVVPKVTYRSPLAGVIQTQDVKDLCSLLVIVSQEAADTFAVSDKCNSVEKREDAEAKSSHDAASEEMDAQREPKISQFAPNNNSIDDQTVRICADSSGLDEFDRKPTSPGTLALMCDEQDTVLMEEGSPRELNNDNQNVASESSSEHIISATFAEQERMVLTKFRDFLNRLITCGSIKETMCSSQNSKEEYLSNGAVKPLAPLANQVPSRIAGVPFHPNSSFTPIIGRPIQNGMLKPKIEKAV